MSWPGRSLTVPGAVKSLPNSLPGVKVVMMRMVKNSMMRTIVMAGVTKTKSGLRISPPLLLVSLPELWLEQ